LLSTTRDPRSRNSTMKFQKLLLLRYIDASLSLSIFVELV
jgi:hypothetical protein